jgi:glycerol-3-phosphate acyltransferase PlsY
MRAVGLPSRQTDGVAAPLVLLVAFLVGAVPFSNIAAHLTRGVDLRTVESGTVSGTSLYKVAGFGPLALAGILDVGKGAIGPLLAGSDRPALAALAGGLAVVGHDWSPFLAGAGGRGISTAMGALLVTAWPGTLLLLAGMALGRIIDQAGFGSFVADLLLVPFLGTVMGAAAAFAGAAVVIPMLVKRVTGNAPPTEPRGRIYARRLLFDCDDPSVA